MAKQLTTPTTTLTRPLITTSVNRFHRASVAHCLRQQQIIVPEIDPGCICSKSTPKNLLQVVAVVSLEVGWWAPPQREARGSRPSERTSHKVTALYYYRVNLLQYRTYLERRQ